MEEKQQIILPELNPQQPAGEPKKVGFFRRHQQSIWLSLVSVALAVGLLLAYIIFFRNGEQAPEYTGDVRVEITAPKESVSGSEISYTVKVTNLSNSALTRVNLEMFYPPGFTFSKAQPEAASPPEGGGRNFVLPDLPRSEALEIVIVGRLEGNVQEIKTTKAKLRYVPENFNSVFLADGSASVVILPPDIIMRVLGPSSTISGQVIDYEVEIRNISIEEFHDLTLELIYPAGFSYLNASPEPQEGKTLWRIPRLAPAGVSIVKISGRMLDAPGEEVFLTAELFTTAQDGRLSAGRSYVFTRMLGSPLLLTQRLVGGEGTIFGEEILQYEINYENVGQIGLSNVTIALRFESNVFDLNKSKSQNGQLRTGEMVWLPGAVPELRTVQVGQRGKFSVQVPVKPEYLLMQKNPVAQTRTQFTADELSEPIAGQPLTLKIGTHLTVVASATRISGPENPVAGQTTIYQVTLTVQNTVNDVEEGELTARLPGSTAVYDESSLEPEEERSNVQYVPTGGLLRWHLGKIFAFSGTLHSSRTISFRLAINHEKTDSSRPILLAEVEATGLDSFTTEQIFSNNLKGVTASK